MPSAAQKGEVFYNLIYHELFKYLDNAINSNFVFFFLGIFFLVAS